MSNKADVAGCLGRLGKVSLGDTVAERDGGGVVDQSKGVKTGNDRGVEHRSALTSVYHPGMAMTTSETACLSSQTPCLSACRGMRRRAVSTRRWWARQGS